MNRTVRNILSLLGGVIFGYVINLGLILIGHKVFPLPFDGDPMDIKVLTANAHLFEFDHFIFPFIAHSIGTLAGAWFVSRFCESYALYLAIAIGVWFMIGGIIMVLQFPSPMWFNILDIATYLPAAYLGYIIAVKNK